ncbi:MAG: ABC transporter permease [Frisingicoccus sp.]|uniref:ABC transporter permease n=1 Tax=Frisingicoccus sp. TaxID=1918627 RepID=UPI002632456A|nr:ABC transporter permease [Frisingicoccus sp.]MDD6232538.1 ABC transporter permease [Frisingicoccus sp.]MDY4834667.1 ABC transporter permease [Frisingicoccus sp.]
MTDKKEKVIQGLVIALITIAVGTVLIMMSNANPAEAYANFFKGIFGNLNGFCEVFVKATPLIFTGLGCAVAFRTGFFNIGAEGQFYVGALTASMVALNVQGAAGIVLALAAGFLAGGVWALIAAVFKAKLGISEIIVTIMLNYIAINLVGIAVRTFLMDPAGSVPQSAKFDSSVWLPQLLPPTRLHAGFILALVSVAVVWFLLEKTTVGYEIKVVGFNKRAAACNGISVMKNIVISAFLSGGLAGMAGVVEVLAIQKKLLEGISSNCGYTAVLIALMAGNHPVGVIVASVAMAAMQVGANTMQRQLGVPSAIVDILIGLVVLLILAKGLIRRKKVKNA